MNLERAIEIAVLAHKGQTVRDGGPYVTHPLRVMHAIAAGPSAPAGALKEALQIVAVLHDVVEDTDWTLDGLRAEGFSEEVVAAVDSVTKREGEDYEAFVERSAGNALGAVVKLADLEDNLDVRRLPALSAKDPARIAKYLKAWRRLKGLSNG